MPSSTGPPPTDTLLAAFLDAVSADEATAALGELLGGDTDRVLRDATRRVLSGSMRRLVDTDDAIGDVRLRLIGRLWALRRGEGEPIDNFQAYAAAAATRVCYSYLRERHPARTRLRNRVRYAVSHHADTELREDADGTWSCRTRKTMRPAPAPGATTAFLDAPATFMERHRLDVTAPLPSLLSAVLERLDRPVAFDRCVDAMAVLLGVIETEALAPREQEDGDHHLQVVDPAPDAATAIADREALRSTWAEVVALPPNQRIALLLNLRDPEGGAMIHVLPATGVVSMEALASALAMDAPDLSALWDRLPIDDEELAGRLGLSRQQVINLRKSARARLARRTTGTRR